MKINQFRNVGGSMRKRRRHTAWVTDIRAFLRALAHDIFRFD